jgi:diguanylate cyclase (GGDEF)-like protein
MGDVAILGVVVPLGLAVAVGWLLRDRRRLRRRVAEAARDHDALEGRLEALAEHNDDLVAALERDLSVAATVANWRAFHDDLTALPNRALLIDRLEQALARRSGREGAVAVLVCDLDRFRIVNESVGRAGGDALLVQVADRLSAAVRPGDTVARVGGDQFVVVAEGFFGDDKAGEVHLPPSMQAASLAERVRVSLADPFAVRSGQPLTLSASIGIVIALGGTPEEALRDADTALARAKDRGRNRTEFFTRNLRTEAVNRLGLEYLLRHALRADGVDVHYQPIVDLTTAETVGGEALLRIRTDGGRLLFPDEFLAVAEETGLIGPLGAVLVERACLQFEQWRTAHPELRRLSVNLAGRQLTEPGVMDGIERAVEAAGLEPRHLCVDVTETSLVESGPAAREALDRLTGSGFGLGIDDFGTGYASLAFARSLPADSIKIDRYLVAGLTTNPEDRALVTAVVELANSIGVATVAEGVETEEQLEVLRLLGCTLGQGYLFSRPVAAAEFSVLLDRPLVPIAAPAGGPPTMQ